MRLIRAELLKIRRRRATWVTLVVALALMSLFIYLTVPVQALFGGVVEFPQAYSVIGEFTFGTGSILAMIFAAAFVGADWNWGVLRNVIARGESRSRYLLAKAAALAIVFAIFTLVMFLVGIVVTFLAAWAHGIAVASPLRGRGLQDIIEWLILGYPVLLQRAALGLAVAVVLRSQLAGAVVGVILYVGEAALTTFLTIATVVGRFGGVFDPDTGPGGGFNPIGPEWFQYLPISMGGNVLNAAPGGAGTTSSSDFQDLFLRSVPLDLALPLVIVYGALAIAAAVLALNRQEIV